MTRLSENSVINLKNKSHSITAQVVVPERGASGVIIAQGGAFAGWSLYLHHGKPKRCHNLVGLQHFYVEAESTVPAATTRCGWNSPKTAAAWPSVAWSPSTSTAGRSARAASRPPCR